MRPFTAEDKPKVQKKLEVIHHNLEMYKRFESQLLTLEGISESMKETGKRIPYLRQDKAREVYTILHKYGWLGEDDLGKEYFNYLLEALEYGDYSRLLDILPYAKQGFAKGKLSEEDYNKIIDIVNNSKDKIISEPKTFK